MWLSNHLYEYWYYVSHKETQQSKSAVDKNRRTKHKSISEMGTRQSYNAKQEWIKKRCKD